jgi:transmembrane sensor
MNLQEAKQFVAHFITGKYTPEEYAIFLQWLKEATTKELNAIADEHEALHERWSLPSAGPSPEWIARLEQKLDESEKASTEVPVKRMFPVSINRKGAWIAAASLLLVVGSGYWYTHRSGSVGAPNAMESLTSTFSNPRGGEEKELTLADGSRVWLNAASTLKYPPSFSGRERVVQLSGEAFFEVTKNSDMPFRVMIRDAEVNVLGTRLNVMAYVDEPVNQTTLIEGSVKIVSGSQDVTLKPGQQAEIRYDDVSAPIRVTGINANNALSWRDGVAQFDDVDLRVVMREIGRWYNVDIQFEPNVPNKPITGVFSRKTGLSKTLEQLQNLNNVHFKNDGKKVTVTL